MTGFGGRRSSLAAAMERRGAWPARAPWIRQAVDAMPREDFAPDGLWRWDGRAYVPVSRAAEPDRWGELVYAGPDEAAVTQLTDGLPSSSLSAQAVVVDMLDSLRLEPGHSVLELGTGTGWNAALLAWRAGPGQVTSVDIDIDLALLAVGRLYEADLAVHVEVGDGTGGWPQRAPYHRVISTYAVERVPWPWVAQTLPGGRIVTPWGRLGHVALTVAEDGRSASGWFQGLAQFMPARGTVTAGRRYRDVRGDGPAESSRPFLLDTAPLGLDYHLLFALRVALPDVRISTARDADGHSAWLHDGHSSWAALSALPSGGTVAYQGGPRRLADELERAWQQWLTLGRPDLYDYGLTVTRDDQYVWVNDPSTGPRWR